MSEPVPKGVLTEAGGGKMIQRSRDNDALPRAPSGNGVPRLVATFGRGAWSSTSTLNPKKADLGSRTAPFSSQVIPCGNQTNTWRLDKKPEHSPLSNWAERDCTRAN